MTTALVLGSPAQVEGGASLVGLGYLNLRICRKPAVLYLHKELQMSTRAKGALTLAIMKWQFGSKNSGA